MSIATNQKKKVLVDFDGQGQVDPFAYKWGSSWGKPNLFIYQVRFTMKASPAYMIGLA